jgi:uncharacterized membrane protein YjjP (DUF1212 family)
MPTTRRILNALNPKKPSEHEWIEIVFAALLVGGVGLLFGGVKGMVIALKALVIVAGVVLVLLAGYIVIKIKL